MVESKQREERLATVIILSRNKKNVQTLDPFFRSRIEHRTFSVEELWQSKRI